MTWAGKGDGTRRFHSIWDGAGEGQVVGRGRAVVMSEDYSFPPTQGQVSAIKKDEKPPELRGFSY